MWCFLLRESERLEISDHTFSVNLELPKGSSVVPLQPGQCTGISSYLDTIFSEFYKQNPDGKKIEEAFVLMVMSSFQGKLKREMPSSQMFRFRLVKQIIFLCLACPTNGVFFSADVVEVSETVINQTICTIHTCFADRMQTAYNDGQVQTGNMYVCAGLREQPMKNWQYKPNQFEIAFFDS